MRRRTTGGRKQDESEGVFDRSDPTGKKTKSTTKLAKRILLSPSKA